MMEKDSEFSRTGNTESPGIGRRDDSGGYGEHAVIGPDSIEIRSNSIDGGPSKNPVRNTSFEGTRQPFAPNVSNTSIRRVSSWEKEDRKISSSVNINVSESYNHAPSFPGESGSPEPLPFQSNSNPNIISLRPRGDSFVPVSWSRFYLDYENLNQRLINVKHEFGLRKSVSAGSLSGETRSFAEILDSEAEKIVLFYLRVQGDLAQKVWELREQHFKSTSLLVSSLGGAGADSNLAALSLPQVEALCERYRALGQEVLDLLEYLDFNVLALRRIVRKHDKHFQSKMSSLYFDSRLGVGGSGEGAALVQLYHQEGLRAIIATIRRGFSELYEARIGALGRGGKGTKTGRGAPQSYFNKVVASISTMNLFDLDDHNAEDYSHGAEERRRSRIRLASDEESRAGGVSPLPYGGSNGSVGRPLVRNLSDLEPVLYMIREASERVLRSQKRTTSEYLASHSIMALENRRDDSDDDNSGSDDGNDAMFAAEEVDGAYRPTEHGLKHGTPAGREDNTGETAKLLRRHHRITSNIGLFANLLVTFLYMANQYVVAPTSGLYSELLGESKFMSGIIIGLSPLAALVSALVYSHWTNYSFKEPLLVSISFAVIGNLLYGLALQNNSESMIFLGRLLSGLGAPRGIARRYIADHVSLKHRTMASSHFVTAGAMGLAIGPFISSMVSSWQCSFTLEMAGVTLVRFEEVSAPGFIMFVLWFLTLLLVLVGFKEPVPATMGVVGTMKSIARSISTAALRNLSGDLSTLDPTVGMLKPSRSLNMQYGSSHDTVVPFMLKGGAGSSCRMSENRKRLDSRDSDYDPRIGGSFDTTDSGDGHDSRSLKPAESSTIPVDSIHERSGGADVGILGQLSDYVITLMGGVTLSPLTSDSPNRYRYTELRESGASRVRLDSDSKRRETQSQLRDTKYDTKSGGGLISVGKDPMLPGQVVSVELATWSSNDSSYQTDPPQRNDTASPALSPQLRAHREDKSMSTKRWAIGTSPHMAMNRDGSPSHTYSSIHNSPGQHLPSQYLRSLQEGGRSVCTCLSYVSVEVAVILFIYVVNKTGQELVVSSVPTLGDTMFKWSSQQAGFFMAAMGALVLPANIVVSQFASKSEDRALVPFLSILVLCSILLLIDTQVIAYSWIQYVLGASVLFAILNALEGVIMSLLSKLVSPELAKGTFNSGLLATEAGMLGRVFGDCMLTYLSERNSVSSTGGTAGGEMINVLFLPVAVGVLGSILLTYRFYERLKS